MIIRIIVILLVFSIPASADLGVMDSVYIKVVPSLSSNNHDIHVLDGINFNPMNKDKITRAHNLTTINITENLSISDSKKLIRKDNDPVVSLTSETPETNEANAAAKESSYWVLWVLVIIILLASVGVFVYMRYYKKPSDIEHIRNLEDYRA